MVNPTLFGLPQGLSERNFRYMLRDKSLDVKMTPMSMSNIIILVPSQPPR